MSKSLIEELPKDGEVPPNAKIIEKLTIDDLRTVVEVYKEGANANITPEEAPMQKDTEIIAKCCCCF